MSPNAATGMERGLKMSQQIYYEDIREGMELPVLEKNPTTQQLVRYAGASGDYYQIHYDQEFARANGLPNVILHGALKNAFLGHLMTDWIGERGTLKKLSVQYRGMDMPGTPIYAKGVVTKRYDEAGEHIVECEIWLQNEKGEKTTPGTAVVSLPSRGGLKAGHRQPAQAARSETTDSVLDKRRGRFQTCPYDVQ